MRKTAITLICAGVLSLLIAACGSSGTSTTNARKTTKTMASTTASTKPVSGQTTIRIKNYMYMPMRLTVTAGTKVTFHNYDQTAHTATALNGGFTTGSIQPGKSSTVVLKKPGTYKYHCLFHAFMVAQITVVKS